MRVADRMIRGRTATAVTGDVRLSEGASFGALLRDHRQLAGLSQDELADRSGLSVDAVSMLERGLRRAPRQRTVELLADALALESEARQSFIVAAQRGAEPEPASRPAAGRSGSRTVLSHPSAVITAGQVGVIVVVAVVELAVLARSAFQGVPFLGPPLRISSVQVESESGEVGHCPSAVFTFKGTIRVASGSGTLTYRWIYPDGRRGREISVRVASGTREVDPKLTYLYTGSDARQGMASLAVVSPRVVSSAPEPVEYRCP